MRKSVIIFSALVMLSTGALLVLRGAPKPVAFTGSDGSRFEVLKVTTGVRHRFRYGNRWQDLVGQYLPGSLRSKVAGS